MPVEIRELIIRAVTTNDNGGQQDVASPQEGDDKQAIIEECVRQVLRILQQKKER